MKKYRKAQKDIDHIYLYSPDNNQINAFKNEIEGLIEKNPVEESSDDEDIDDDEDQLKFSNLKHIDRTSKDLSASTRKLNLGRKSRVTILGDSTVEYCLP